MRAWIWTLLLFGLAVAIAILVHDYTGNLVLVVPPWRIEISLVFAVIVVVAAFVLLHLLLRLSGWTFGLAPRWRAWRAQRQLVREHQRLEQGWIRLLQGHYVKSREDFLAVTDASSDATRNTLAQLGVARTALAVNDATVVDTALEDARRSARHDAGLRLAVACTAADLMLTQGRPEAAASWLAEVQASNSRHVHLQRLALKTHLALGHWEVALRQARSLQRHHDGQGGLDAALAQAAAGYLASAADENEAQAIWKRLKAPERLIPDVALTAARVFAEQPQMVRQILQQALETELDPRLLSAYSQCDASEVGPRLQRAETWLQRQPHNADLLRTLGRLCLRGELWGPASTYLQRSLQEADDPRTHALLGTLYDHLGRHAEASTHWRQATALDVELGEPPKRSRVLPVAQTHADPARADAEVIDLDLAEDRVAPSANIGSHVHEADDTWGAADVPPRIDDGPEHQSSEGASAPAAVASKSSSAEPANEGSNSESRPSANAGSPKTP